MIFSSILTLVEKDLKLFFRSKISAIFILLLPLIIVLFAGYGFSSDKLSGVNVAVYSDSYSEISENIILSFEENNFSSRKYSSLNECIEAVKISDAQICVLFPKDLTSEGSMENVIFYVDYSRTNFVDTLINLVDKKVSSESSNLGTALVQTLIDNLNSVKNSLEIEREKLNLASGKISDLKSSVSMIKNPVEDLDNIISDLKNYEDSSLIDSEISHLEDLSSEISISFDSLANVNSQSVSIKTELDSVISNLNSLIISLNSLKVGNAEDIVSPIEISLESVDGSNSKREYIFPIVLSLISLFGAILISSTLVLKNKKTLAYFRNFVTPTRDFTFIFSIYLTCLVILFIQFILVFMGVYFIFDMNFFVLPFETSVLFILGWSVFIFVGTFLGYMLRSEESIIFSSVLVASFLMFFSDLILPLENISEELFKIASYNPLVVMQSALKKIYLFELGFEEIWIGLVVLGGFVFIFGTLSYFIRKATKRNL